MHAAIQEVSVLMSEVQDLDSAEAISEFVKHFYAKLLADPELSPIFLQTANINVETHFPRIEAFWRKLLLREAGYDRHMMNIHRLIHERHPFTPEHFSRWLQHLEHTLDEHYCGRYTDQARNVARSIASNLQEALLNPKDYSHRTRYIEDRAPFN